MTFENPFRPGAGHKPPYLAGRTEETSIFQNLLKQSTVLDNVVFTGLRGVGKTVLLETLKPSAVSEGWLWVGTDMSEAATLTEKTIAMRLCADLSVLTASIPISESVRQLPGFTGEQVLVQSNLTYDTLLNIFEQVPGLAVDKLKCVIDVAWKAIIASRGQDSFKGIVFSYDEAQNLSDHAGTDSYPLSLLLDCFQSLQRQGLPVLLVLTGLPTLFPKLVDSRTFSERMFRVITLEGLSDEESRLAIVKPIEDVNCPAKLSENIVESIIEMSGGYPYFIQFICREIFDLSIQLADRGEKMVIPVNEIEQKLDSDFFAGRWARATDRQRELLFVAASLESPEGEFTVQEIADKSEHLLDKKFGNSQINQMFLTLSSHGLIFRNRHGKYSFAVPLLHRFIKRQGLPSTS